MNTKTNPNRSNNTNDMNPRRRDNNNNNNSNGRLSFVMKSSFIIFIFVTIYHLNNSLTKTYENDLLKLSDSSSVYKSKPLNNDELNVSKVYHDDDDDDENENDDGDENENDDNDGNKNYKKPRTTIFSEGIPSEYLANDEEHEKCKFQQSKSAPTPVILMALGRSGSSVTWDTLTTMLGSTTKASEIPGGNQTKSIDFLNSRTDPKWPINKSCYIQNKNRAQFVDPPPVITGFQWKPYIVSLNHTMGKAGLEAIANHNHHNSTTTIKIIFLTRNPLERLMSNTRHKGRKGSKEVPAHCAIDDEECVKRQKELSKGTVLPTGKNLVHSLKSALRTDQMCKTALSSNGLQYLHVTYANLYNPPHNEDDDDAFEWKRIFDFLGKSPKNMKNYRTTLTMKHVRDAFAIAPTSSKLHEDIIQNYDEVKQSLVQAGLGYLIH